MEDRANPAQSTGAGPTPTPPRRILEREGKRERDAETEAGNPSKWERRRTRWQNLIEPSGSDTDSQEEMHSLDDILKVTIPPGTAPPIKGSNGSAGWDLKANQSVTLHPGHTTKVDLGLWLATPPGFAMILFSRSRLASEGITTQGGVIDSDYRGVVNCLLYNSTKTPRRITKGERICQGLVLPVPQIEWIQGQLGNTQRDEGGFGSTGA